MPHFRRRALLTDWRVPTPLPDELGYSVIASFLRSWRGVDSAGLITQVMGYTPSANHPVCPPGVARVAALCLAGRLDPPNQFIRDHTLVPYYLAFEPRSSATQCMEALRTNPRASASKLLRTASLQIGAPQGLRLCRTCFDEDTRRFSEPYWHRVHQLPGTYHCLIHQSRLLTSSIPFLIDKRLTFRSPRSDEVIAGLRSDEHVFYDRRLERQIADRSADLLEAPRSLASVSSSTAYRRTLMQFGFGGRRNELRTTAFGADFVKWLAAHRCRPEHIGAGRWWLRLMTEIPGRSTPLQHLILQQYLRDQMRVDLAQRPDMFGFDQATLS